MYLLVIHYAQCDKDLDHVLHCHLIRVEYTLTRDQNVISRVSGANALPFLVANFPLQLVDKLLVRSGGQVRWQHGVELRDYLICGGLLVYLTLFFYLLCVYQLQKVLLLEDDATDATLH